MTFVAWIAFFILLVAMGIRVLEYFLGYSLNILEFLLKNSKISFILLFSIGIGFIVGNFYNIWCAIYTALLFSLISFTIIAYQKLSENIYSWSLFFTLIYFASGIGFIIGSLYNIWWGIYLSLLFLFIMITFYIYLSGENYKGMLFFTLMIFAAGFGFFIGNFFGIGWAIFTSILSMLFVKTFFSDEDEIIEILRKY